MPDLMPVNINPLAAGARQAAEAGRLADQALSAAEAKRDAEIWKAAEGFERLFLGMMLKQMRETTMEEEDSIFNTNATKTYQAMMDDTFAEVGAQRRQFGIARMIHDHMAGKPAFGGNSPQVASSKIRQYQEVQESSAGSATVCP